MMTRNSADTTMLGSTERGDRRGFLRFAGRSALSVCGATLLGACGDETGADGGGGSSATPTPTPTPPPVPTDADQLTVPLNLLYLQAQFYSYAAFGLGVGASLLGGVGTPGTVLTGSGAGMARQVPFVDPTLQQLAREIAIEKVAQLAFLRNALGGATVTQPTLNLSSSASVSVSSTETVVGSFNAVNAALRALGVAAPTEVWDVYGSEQDFLLAALLFEDLAVTAYRGALALLSLNKPLFEASAGLFVGSSYHAGLIRIALNRKALVAPSLYRSAEDIRFLRNRLDGNRETDAVGIPGDDEDMSYGFSPSDDRGTVFTRTAAEVLNILFLNQSAVSAGGFFPAGVNGAFRTSAANG